MWQDRIIFGISMTSGTPYVETCHGTVVFETVEDAASFVGERTLLRLGAYKSLWDSFEATVASHSGALEPDAFLADVRKVLAGDADA